MLVYWMTKLYLFPISTKKEIIPGKLHPQLLALAKKKKKKKGGGGGGGKGKKLPGRVLPHWEN